MFVKIKEAKKPAQGDVNWLTREKGSRSRDGMDRKRFETNYDQIKWKSKKRS